MPFGQAAATTIEATIYTQQGERMFTLETASTPTEREQGLMNRDRLKPNDGMVFLFPRAGRYKFWMKDTRIPLDMIFIDDTQTVVAIEADVPPNSTGLRTSKAPAIAVIELDGGRAAREGIAPGDKVRYVLPETITVE